MCAAGIDCEVASFSTKPVGTGQLGTCIRFKLTYKHAAPNAPASVVGKFPGEGEDSRKAGFALGTYLREVKFYQLLQARTKIATPICYCALVNEVNHDFVILMEDLSPAEQGDQLTGTTLDQARLAIIEGAKLHASFWNADELDNYAWVNESKSAPPLLTPELAQGLWVGFCERYGERVTPQAKQIGDAASVNLDVFQARNSGNKSLVHSDFRPDNMMFETAQGGSPITIIDWQSFGYSAPATDIGYFMAGALDAKIRRENEDNLLDLYASELVAQNVTNYTQKELKQHYVFGAYALFFTAYTSSVMVTQTDRGDDMFFRMLNGAVDLINDSGANNWFT